MIQKFIDLMSSFTTLTKEEEEYMRVTTVIKQFNKGSFILKAGERTKDTFLILEGCVRRYLLVDGVEKTIGFFEEGEAVAEFESLSTKKPTLHSYSCVEDTVVVVVNSKKEKEFYEKFPRFEEISRLEMEKMLGKNQEKLSNFISKSPEERYKHLVNAKPDLIQRVPQHQIASYLGVTPESLSRIKKRIMKL